jgi:hypothetical protein
VKQPLHNCRGSLPEIYTGMGWRIGLTTAALED